MRVSLHAMTRQPIKPLRVRPYPGPPRSPLGLALLLTRILMRIDATAGLGEGEGARPPVEGGTSPTPSPPHLKP